MSPFRLLNLIDAKFTVDLLVLKRERDLASVTDRWSCKA
jgi:hypothetical protein